MFTLNPGPSQMNEEVKNDIIEFAKNDIGSMSHRSKQFSAMSEKLHNNLRELLDIPDNYKIFYTGSSTESMEILIRNFVISNCYFFQNGAFSSKFQNTAKDLNKTIEFQELDWGKGDYSLENIGEDIELIGVTNNETSTGVRLRDGFLKDLKKLSTEGFSPLHKPLIAVDITSSIGMTFEDINLADIWFFSVQKGLGLPAGLGFLIVNEKAINKSKIVKEKLSDVGSVHSIENMLKKYDIFQTNETPNVFAIYLLANQLERYNKITSTKIEENTLEKYKYISEQIKNHPLLSDYVEDENYKSKSVYVVKCEEKNIFRIKEELLKNDIILGGGYGKLKKSTFRIANFPAINLEKLKETFDIINKLK
ncbi:MAG: aminotransferase class V-fold PLP-dependent enzyme [Candidatus Gracilibacteria bacterium]|nr:aminotransferase class V-fold PLP-dependent enzyme [Candidatus Gracilibacteria bacterium]MDQ7023464.1 aminotransferase class V-fold PLP-dependent enzyme [Candidatus Gracilibacteria bacterium]